MKAFLHYVIIALLLTGWLSVYIPYRYEISYPQPLGPQLDKRIRQTYREEISAQKPDIVLIGDSVLVSAIDTATLASQLHQKIYNIGQKGTAATLWYLIIKNNVVKADHNPAYLVIFFRDSVLTVPDYKVGGTYLELLDEYASPDDTVLIERAFLNHMSLPEQLAERYFPLYGSRWVIRQRVDAQLRYLLPGVLLGCDKSCVDSAMEDVFQGANFHKNMLTDSIIAADDYIYRPAALDFSRQVGQSFLPEIIRMCHEQNIQLVLVRMKTLRFGSEDREPAALKTYMNEMESYLEQNQVILLDFAHDERLTPDLFADPVHFNQQGKEFFTNLLTESWLALSLPR